MNIDFTEEEMNRLFSILRSELGNLSVREIKDIVTAAGFDVASIPSTSEEMRTGLRSKTGLLTGIEWLFGKMKVDWKPTSLTILAEKLTGKNPELDASVQEILGKHGFQFINGAFVPIGVLDARERQYLPSSAASNLEKAMERLGNGDYTGAITSACGAVDLVTQAIYLRDIGPKPPHHYVGKLNEVLNHLRIFDEMKNEFLTLGMANKEASDIIAHMQQATRHAAEALQILRHSMGDTHGSKPAMRKTAYDAIKWASAICGLLEDKI